MRLGFGCGVVYIWNDSTRAQCWSAGTRFREDGEWCGGAATLKRVVTVRSFVSPVRQVRLLLSAPRLFDVPLTPSVRWAQIMCIPDGVLSLSEDALRPAPHPLSTLAQHSRSAARMTGLGVVCVGAVRAQGAHTGGHPAADAVCGGGVQGDAVHGVCEQGRARAHALRGGQHADAVPHRPRRPARRRHRRSRPCTRPVRPHTPRRRRRSLWTRQRAMGRPP